MKFFVGIDLGTTNSGRFESGGTVDALQVTKIFNVVAAFIRYEKFFTARQTSGNFFVTISAAIDCGC